MHVQKIEELPDYPVLRQVQNALWKIGKVHGAAVMVGAGFSQFANRAAETTPLAPLWTDFQKAMLDELYPEGGGPSDPLSPRGGIPGRRWVFPPWKTSSDAGSGTMNGARGRFTAECYRCHGRTC